jgi:hypothetical protein
MGGTEWWCERQSFKGFWVRTGASHGHKVSHTAMDYQGAGTLVLTTIGLCFIGANSTRIPLSHILAFQSYSDGIGFDTDYARNNRHVFTQIHAANVAFIATVLDTIKGGVSAASLRTLPLAQLLKCRTNAVFGRPRFFVLDPRSQRTVAAGGRPRFRSESADNSWVVKFNPF